jgi:hypothetical protein
MRQYYEMLHDWHLQSRTNAIVFSMVAPSEHTKSTVRNSSSVLRQHSQDVVNHGLSIRGLELDLQFPRQTVTGIVTVVHPGLDIRLSMVTLAHALVPAIG